MRPTNRLDWILGGVTGGAALVTLIAIALLWPSGSATAGTDLGVLYDATVLSVESAKCEATDAEAACRVARVRLRNGPDRGRVESIDAPLGPTAPRLRPGQRIVVAHYDNPEAVDAGVEYQFADRNRKAPLFALAALFAVAVIVLGRLRGLAALAGLAVSLLVLVQFVLPAILDGAAPVPVAVAGASAIAFVALYASHGVSRRTTVALLGTLGGLACALAAGAIFTEAAALTGLATEDATMLSIAAGRIDFAGLLLAGLLIGALGAIDDVTVTQASAVWELRAAGPSLTRREIRGAAMRIGRDHVGSTVNTLILAYAGASMSLLLLFALSASDVRQVANGELVATEIVRTLAGSLGLIASVPITTWLAAAVVPEAVEPQSGIHAHV